MAAVVPIRVLTQIGLQMLALDPVVRAQQKGFGVGNGTVQPLHVIRVILRVEFHRQHRPVLGQGRIGGKPVVHDGRFLLDMLVQKGGDGLALHILDGLHAQVARLPVGRQRQRDEGGRLVGATPWFRVLARTADVRLVHLDEAAELVRLLADAHGVADLVQHSPSGLVGDVNFARKSQRRYAPLVVGCEEDRPEPLAQWGARLFEDGADRQGSLMSASGRLTLQQVPAPDYVEPVMPAPRATESIRKA